METDKNIKMGKSVHLDNIFLNEYLNNIYSLPRENILYIKIQAPNGSLKLYYFMTQKRVTKIVF